MPWLSSREQVFHSRAGLMPSQARKVKTRQLANLVLRGLGRVGDFDTHADFAAAGTSGFVFGGSADGSLPPKIQCALECASRFSEDLLCAPP